MLRLLIWNVAIFACSLPSLFVAQIGLCVLRRCWSPRRKPRKEQTAGQEKPKAGQDEDDPFAVEFPRFNALMMRLTWIGWSVALLLCRFWMKVTIEGRDDFARGTATEKPRLLISNHTSFLDSIVLLVQLPFSIAPAAKIMVAARLLKMWGLGTILTGMGHVAIPYKDERPSADVASSEGESITFATDVEKIATAMARFENWVSSGKVGVWFPEGVLNHKDPRIIQQFRAGGFVSGVKVDCELWSFIHCGCSVGWPSSDSFGGYPCHIRGKFVLTCDSTHKCLADAGIPLDDEKAASIFLAGEMCKRAQSVLDELTGVQH